MLIGKLAPRPVDGISEYSITSFSMDYVPEFLVWRKTNKISLIRIEIISPTGGRQIVYSSKPPRGTQTLPVSPRVNYSFIKFAHGSINLRTWVTFHYKGLQPRKIWAIRTQAPRVNVIPDGL